MNNGLLSLAMWKVFKCEAFHACLSPTSGCWNGLLVLLQSWDCLQCCCKHPTVGFDQIQGSFFKVYLPNLKAWKMGLFYNWIVSQGAEPGITLTLQTWPLTSWTPAITIWVVWRWNCLMMQKYIKKKSILHLNFPDFGHPLLSSPSIISLTWNNLFGPLCNQTKWACTSLCPLGTLITEKHTERIPN